MRKQLVNAPVSFHCKNSIYQVPVAQWIARWTSNPKVPGSNPGRDSQNVVDPTNNILVICAG